MQGQIHACTAQGCPRIINSAMGSFSGLLPLCNLPVFSGSSGSLPVLLPDSSSFHHPHSPPSDCAYTQGQAAGIEVEGKNLIQVYSILVGPHFLPSEQGVLTPPSKMRQLWHCTEAGMQEKQSRRQSHPLWALGIPFPSLGARTQWLPLALSPSTPTKSSLSSCLMPIVLYKINTA